jgi:hypothetical protein
MNRFRRALDTGFARPVRFRIGEAANTWAAEVHRLADALDAEPLSPQVDGLLTELFVEIGQQARDLQALP